MAALAEVLKLRNYVLLVHRQGVLAVARCLLEEGFCKLDRVGVLESSWSPSKKGDGPRWIAPDLRKHGRCLRRELVPRLEWDFLPALDQLVEKRCRGSILFSTHPCRQQLL